MPQSLSKVNVLFIAIVSVNTSKVYAEHFYLK